MEIESFQLPHLLRYEDRNSMHHSIEARLPFLDYRLVETCYGIDSHLKIRQGWTKHILRVAMHGLAPDSILWRKNKFGFEAPIGTWINDASGAMEPAIRQAPLMENMCQDRLDLKTPTGPPSEALQHRQMGSGLRGAVRRAGGSCRLTAGSKRAGQPISMMK